jgi:hypothetical protein
LENCDEEQGRRRPSRLRSVLVIEYKLHIGGLCASPDRNPATHMR